MQIPARLLLQIPFTLAILAWVPTNLGKLAALSILWIWSFRRLTRTETIFFVATCLFFTAMNAASLKQGIFAFSEPDLLGMPLYELLMWGFYLLHTKRVLNGPAPAGPVPAVWILALLYSASFALIHDGNHLLMVTGALLAVGLILFHERLDLAYTAYLIVLGAAIEYTGVYSGEWSYPGNPPGGVPLWFVTLWGGVGLFLRRLVVPVLARHERAGSASQEAPGKGGIAGG